jgi:hypothetical protein
MAFGNVMVALDEASISGARMLLNIISLLTDRERVAADIREWVEAGKKLEVARAEHEERLREIDTREKALAAAEARLKEEAAQVADQQRQAQFQLQRAEEAMASLKEMRAELKQKLAA